MARNRIRRQVADYSDNPHAELMALWSLRALVRLKGNRKFINKEGFEDQDILSIVGLPNAYEADNIKRNQAKKLLENRLNALESKKITQKNDLLVLNIKWLAKTLSLSNEDQLILLYTILVDATSDLRDALDTIPSVGMQQMPRHLSIILNIAIEKCKSSLKHDGTLINSGLISWNYNLSFFGSRLSPLAGLAHILQTEHLNKQDILNSFFEKSPKAKLDCADYKHIASDYHLISRYIKSVICKRTSAVNILIYGNPGVGKTEFVRMLVGNLNLNLFEIAMQDENGGAITGSSRFSTYQLSQKLLAQQKNCVILFDEVEDVFPEHVCNVLHGDKKVNNKAWVNQLLENNPVPAFWVCNKVHQIDSAYLRRFDYVMEIRQPPQSTRHKIIKKYLHNNTLVNDKWMKNVASNENISPAFIEKASKVADHIAGEHEKSIENTLDKVIGNMLDVFGHEKTRHKYNTENIEYDIDYLNTNQCLTSIRDGLRQSGEGRLCLYGPPGTGKTAFSQYLANYVDRPLIIRRASDILSKWVGGTEENIAEMFRLAREEKSVLLLDEADSFIQSRESAIHSWEITQVNELLVQLENFDGIFIASTNFLKILDSASLRRFDFKIKFDYMKNNAAFDIFRSIVTENKWQNLQGDDELTKRLSSLQKISLGDFLVAARKMKFLKNKTSDAFLKHIEGEIKLKDRENDRAIGFMAKI